MPFATASEIEANQNFRLFVRLLFVFDSSFYLVAEHYNLWNQLAILVSSSEKIFPDFK